MIRDPIITAVSLTAALIHIVSVNGFPKISFILRCISFMAAAALLNPLFSHNGVTVLFFFKGLPITLEALLFGAEMSFAACAVMVWCASLSRFMTSDKIIMLLGSVTPKLAILLSLTLRFIPMIQERHKNIINAQKGLYPENEGRNTLSFHISVYSALTSQLLEDSVEIADSMRSRGIRLKGRTFYSEFRICRHDRIIIAVTVLLMTAVIVLTAKGAADFSFYPMINGADISVFDVLLSASFALLCALCLI